MNPLPWYLGGLALAAVAVTHRFSIGKSLAVSGRFSALVDRVRHGKAETESMSDAELIALMQAATASEFGGAPSAQTSEPIAMGIPTTPREAALPKDIAFLVGLFLGGLVFALATKSFFPVFDLHSKGLTALSLAIHLPKPFILLFGGVLVGFGTRMAGGCTSGHGLCGVSRLQTGSFLTTASFFGVGVGVSYLIEAIL